MISIDLGGYFRDTMTAGELIQKLAAGQLNAGVVVFCEGQIIPITEDSFIHAPDGDIYINASR